MALRLFHKGRYALDIGGSSVVFVGVGGKPGRLKLQSCFEWPISPGLVEDGEITDADLVGRELKAMVSNRKLRGKPVLLAVSNQKLIVRNIDMPDMTEEELLGAIHFQAQEYIPIPIDEVVLDSQVTGKRMNPDGTARLDVLLVAAQKTMISSLLSTMQRAGLKVSGIDIASLALVRALLPEGSFFGDAEEEGVCQGIAHISSSASTLVVAVGGVMKFTRIVNFSSDRFAKTLVDQKEISFADAQIMVQRVGLPGPVPGEEEYYDPQVVAEIQAILAGVAAELAEEIRRSFDYYQGQEHAGVVAELVLSGQGALLRNLDSYLATSLGIPVVIGNPLRHIAENATGIPDAELAMMAPSLSVAVGLALPEDD